MKEQKYNRLETPALEAPTLYQAQETIRGGLAADCTKKSAHSPATAGTSPHGRGRQPRQRPHDAFRAAFGGFIADECGVRYVREEQEFDPKSAEKTLPERYPLTEGDVSVCREEVRRGKVPGSCMEGILHWLQVYGGLTGEQKSEAEAGRSAQGGEW